jgi:hypothetical protein
MAGLQDYSRQETDLALQLLLELVEHLKAYKDHIVLVGGWAPYFLLKDAASKLAQQHIGSLDADLFLDFRAIQETGYETIIEILERDGYSQRKDRQGKVIPASFEKVVRLEGGGRFPMRVDFLAAEYGGTARSHRHQKVEDLLAHKARGADIAREQNFTHEISGQLPNRARVTVRLKIANEVAVFTMKGILVGQRTKPKDYYDLYMLVKHFKKGPRSLAESIKPFLANKLVREAITHIRRYFERFDSLGPNSVAEFFHPSDPEAWAVIQRDAFEQLQALLNEIDRYDRDVPSTRPREGRGHYTPSTRRSTRWPTSRR